ncbi:MAG: hypothetical protein KTV77_04410 [Wolbachia endosymbiont of Fragariocoptes setiger]|nr:hypothetical protein [Wolbachia endosymbiont of Fragariocoptes setiger]
MKSCYNKGDLNQGIKKVKELFRSALNVVQNNAKIQKTLHDVREKLLLQTFHGDPGMMEFFRNAIVTKDEPNAPNEEVPSAPLFDYHQVGSTIEEITDISSALYPDLTGLER